MNVAETQWEPVAPHPRQGARSGVASVTSLRPARDRRMSHRREVQVAASAPQLRLAISEPATTPVTSTDLPDAQDRAALERFVPRFCAVVIEVIGGDRGVQQLLRWTTEQVYSELICRSTALHGTVGGDQRLRRLRATVRSVHIFWPSAHAAEVSVHVRQGDRSRALAARIELIDGRWLCSVLQFG